MRQRTLTVWHRFRDLAFAGMILGAASSTRADHPLTYEQAEVLQTRKMTEAIIVRGGGMRELSIGQLPKELEVDSAKVSLVPDLKDSYDALIVVYLANGSEQALSGADSNYAHCFLEVKDGNRWRACERFIPGCISGPIPEPESLGPGLARTFLGTNPNQGDMTGELRFCIVLPDVRPIVSASFQGRFSSKQFEEATLPPRPASKAIADGLADMIAGKAPEKSPWRIAYSPEEYIAAAELERCYDESGTTKTAIIRWQASAPSGEEMAACRKAVEALLKRPWDRQKDARALFDRCFTALTQKGGNPDFGSPEHCRATTWRYLSEFRSEWLEVFVNPERWDQLEAIRRSGNPWGVDQNRVATLVEEAITSLHSSDPEEREAAGIFLNGYWITEHHLRDERCWFLLDQDIASLRKAAIAALARRGKGQQAGKWLLDHRDLPGHELPSLWEAAVEDRRIFADWEFLMGLRLLDTSPLETAGTLGLRSGQIKDAGGKPLPVALREPLRQFLVKEAEAKRSIGLPPPKPGESPHTTVRITDPRNNEPMHLKNALRLLAAWEDPADTPLLRSYLTHPAANYLTSEQQVIRWYAVRSTAAQLLKERNEKVPDGIVFEEPVN